MDIFIKGLVLGFSIAAVVGPIGILCIQRTLTGGKLYGFISGLGAATADALYASIAAFGLVFISSALVSNRVWIQAIGGIILLYLGLKIFFSKATQSATADTANKRGLIPGYGSILFLTITNPMTILSFVAAFAGFGITAGANYALASLFVFGVFAGSSLWWFVLSWATASVKNILKTEYLDWIHKIAGIVIACFGVFSLMSIWI